MKIAAVGDIALVQGFPENGYKDLNTIKKYLDSADVKVGNLETNIFFNKDVYASSYSGGTWMRSDFIVLKQITDLGFSFLGYANNHTMDYGPLGMLETISNVEKCNIKVAGAGDSMPQAAEPKYRTFGVGRVSFLAATSSFNPTALAGHPTSFIKGRPGVNGIRYQRELHLSPEHFIWLQEILDSTQLEGQNNVARQAGFRTPVENDTLLFNGIACRVKKENENEGKYTYCNKIDLNRMVGNIKDAKQLSDYCIVMLHSHEMKGSNPDEPDYMTEELAHACIDAGADVIIGSGTHSVRPIEIYKGKPVFYSLGNFCFQTNIVEHQPWDYREKNNIYESQFQNAETYV